MSGKITWKQSGQERAYGDSIYAGTIEAETEQEARDGLQKARGYTNPILNAQAGGGDWSMPYFTMLRLQSPGLWLFRFVTEYTG